MSNDNSMPEEGVPKGKIEQRTWESSKIYPDSKRDYWVYIPEQYNAEEPACLMVFQDGGAYVHPEGQVRATTVFDNLIHSGEMPITIAVFVNPGMIGEESTRPIEYVDDGKIYSRFLLEEIIPEVTKDYNLVDDREGWSICGMSDGGLCSFAVAWQRNDIFSKSICHIASFARNVKGADFPYLVRQTRRDPKPLRVFLADGENDLNLDEGNWTIGNLNLASALQFAKYDYRLEMGPGGHDLAHGGELFPETLRWIWRDYPSVKAARPNYDQVTGQWSMVTNFFGLELNSTLNVSLEGDTLTATLQDEKDGELEVTNFTFEGGAVTYHYIPPTSQASWGKGTSTSMIALLRIKNDILTGTVSGLSDGETLYDHGLTGQRA